VAALVRLRPLTSLDLWWHLSMGEAVLAGRGRVVEDPTSFAPDVPYRDPEWLFDVGALGVWNVAGIPGLIAATALLAGASAVAVFWVARRVGAGPWTSVVVAALAVGGASWRFDPRPQSLFLVLLPLAMALAIAARTSDGRSRWGYLAGLVVTCLVWSQSHSSMVIAPAVVWPLALHRWRGTAVSWAPIHLAVLGLLVFVPFLGPHGFGVVGQIVAHSGSDAARHITDMRPMPWYGWIPKPGNSMMFIEIMLVVAVVAALRAKRVPVALVALALLGLAMTVTAHRFRAAWALMLVPLVADLLVDLDEKRWTRWVAVACPPLLAVALWWGEPGPSLRWDRTSVPTDATEAMDALSVRGRVFNDYDGGGWIGWAMAPHVQVYIDGRTPTFFDDQHYRAAREAWADGAAFEGLHAEHTFDMVLVMRTDPLCGHLDAVDGWEPAWFGETRALFLPAGRGRSLDHLSACAAESSVGRCQGTGDPEPFLDEVDRLLELGEAHGYPARLGTAIGLFCGAEPHPRAAEFLEQAREADAKHPDLAGFEAALVRGED